MQSREIKFRAWDKNHNMMIYPMKLYDRMDKSYTNWDIIDMFEDEDIMQYTWLKDKNWLEIYVGDIIKYKTSKNQFTEVKYIDDWFKITLYESPTRRRTSMLSHFLSQRSYQVVWNIYQNPELLTQ